MATGACFTEGMDSFRRGITFKFTYNVVFRRISFFAAIVGTRNGTEDSVFHMRICLVRLSRKRFYGSNCVDIYACIHGCKSQNRQKSLLAWGMNCCILNN